MKTIKTLIPAILIFCSFMLLAGSGAQAQSGNSCNEGKAIGKAHSLLAACVAAARPDLEINFYVTGNSIGGYSVSVFGAPRCNPGEICPLYIFLIGFVILDSNCEVVQVSCGFN